MSTSDPSPLERPNLRRIQAVEVELDGEPMVVLHDPGRPESQQVVVSQAALALISLFDGTLDIPALQDLFEREYGDRPEADLLREVIRQLDEALLLDSPRYREDLEARRAVYRTQACRPMILAPTCFPVDGAEAGPALDAFFTLEDGPGRAPKLGAGPPCAAVMAPHIDYDRGAALYAQSYLRVAEGAADADLFVILGTDHRGELDEPFTLTTLDYDTPFGPLPTDRALVERLVEACGEGVIDNELAHGLEHSVEFQMVLLRHVLGAERAARARVLPVLCGPLPGRNGTGGEERQRQVDRFLDALASELRDRKACLIAAADLAHLGPAFQSEPLDEEALVELEGRDRQTLDLVMAGRVEPLDWDVTADDNARQICSHAALHSLLRLRPGLRGELLGYRQCPVPEDDTDGSRVTIAAVAFPET